MNNTIKNANAKRNFLKVMVIPTIFSFIIYFLYSSTQNKIERLLLLFVFGTLIVPLVFQLLNMCIRILINFENPNLKNKNYNSGQNNKIETISKCSTKNYKTNTQKENNTLYTNLRDNLKELSREKQLGRSEILSFKNELDYRLANHRYNYSNFKFENDMHEIYTKLKSSKLKDDDYIYLQDTLNSILNP